MIPGQFRYILSKAQYEREFGKNYYKPSFTSRMIAGIVRILPKIGPLRAIDPKPPTAGTEKAYIKGLEVAVTDYRKTVHGAADQEIVLPNIDLDTGKPTAPGEYKLADGTYERLLRELAIRDFNTVSPELRDNILAYYGDLTEPISTKHSKCDWKEVLRDLDALKKHTATVPKAETERFAGIYPITSLPMTMPLIIVSACDFIEVCIEERCFLLSS